MIHENRILVTGSRTWFDTDTIREALLRHYSPSSILVSGACPTGADAIAERLWTELGGKVERHPAHWGRYGRSAGHRRNHEMVALGATVCLAFILDHSPGSTGCVSAARLARIPVELHEVISQQAGRAIPADGTASEDAAATDPNVCERDGSRPGVCWRYWQRVGDEVRIWTRYQGTPCVLIAYLLAGLRTRLNCNGEVLIL